jgi:hypothetical protein
VQPVASGKVEQSKYIVPLYAARLEHLTHALSVTATCICGHVAEVSVEVLWKRLPLSTRISDLPSRLRCEACDEKGRCEIDVRRALGYDRLE